MEGLLWADCLSDVKHKERQWLWSQRIPLGEITLIAGIQGMGKSLLSAKLAYHVTNGAPWPDKTPCPLGDFILLQAEDSTASTVRPRYDAAKVNTDRVFTVRGASYRDKKHKERVGPFELNRDLDQLIKLIKHPRVKKPRVILIDPIGSYIGANVDIHRENSVRSIMYKIKQIANTYHVAFIIVVHLRKGGSEDPVLSRVLGSVAFTGSARTVWGVAHDDEEQHKRYFLPMKHNLTSGAAPGYEFHLSTAPNGEGVVTWGKVSNELASEKMVDHGDRAQSKVGKAGEIIVAMLKDGPRNTIDIKEEIGQNSMSWRTANSAKEKLGIKSYREGTHWMWRLDDA